MLHRIKEVITLSNQRMEYKLLIIFVVYILLPITMLSYISYVRYTHMIQSKTVGYVTELTANLVKKMDNYTHDIQKISTIPAFLNEVPNALNESNNFYQNLSDQNYNMNLNNKDYSNLIPYVESMKIHLQAQIEQSIYFMTDIKQGINSIYIFDKYGNPYYAYKSGGQRTNLNLKDSYHSWQNRADKANGSPVLLGTEKFTNTMHRSEYVFTVVKSVIDNSFENVGIIVIDSDIGVIANMVSELDQTVKGNTYIVDKTGRVIYANEKKYMGTNLRGSKLIQDTSDKNGHRIINLNGKKNLAIYMRSQDTGWEYIVTIPYQQMMLDVRKNQRFTLLITITIITFALLLSIVLSFALTKRLRELMRMMKRVQKGDWDVHFPVKYPDEAGQLGRAFNRMIRQMKDLIRDVYIMEIRKKEAELSSLQYQINPHFMYNTLESIRMTSELNDDLESADMIQSLGKMLRYSVSESSSFVPLSKEMEHLHNYVSLLSFRYPNRFNLNIQPYADISQIKVMKLLFQPIVENAIYHGLDENKQSLNIGITFQVLQTNIQFTVHDNGMGMEPGKLKQLRDKIKSNKGSDEGRGIGLWNVHERIRLFYGETYGLTIDSSHGIGTTITITLPLLQEHKADDVSEE